MISESELEPRFLEIPDPAAVQAEERQRAPLSPPRLPSAPTRRTLRRTHALGVLGGIAWIAAHVSVYGVRADLPELPAGYIAAQVGVPLGLAAASWFVAQRVGRLGLGARRSLVLGLVLLGPLSYSLLAVALPTPRAVPASGDAPLGALVCLDIGLVLSAVPLLAGTLALRHAFVSAAGFRSALVGSACGLLSGAALNLHCPNVDPLHLLSGHALVVVFALLAGAGFSRWTRA